MSNYFDQFDPKPGEAQGNYFDQFDGVPPAGAAGVPSRGAARATADTGLGVAQGGLNIVSGGMRLVDLAARFNPGGPAGLVFYRSLLNNGGNVGAALKQTKDVVLAPESALSYSAGNVDRSSGMLQELKSESLQRTAQESNQRIGQQGDQRDAAYLASLPADDRAALEAARAAGPLEAAGTYIRRPGLALGALKGVAAEAKDQAVELANNPSLAVDFAAQQVPQFLGTGGAIKLATRGLAGEAAAEAGQRAALGAGTAMEAGGAAGQAAQQFEQMPEGQLLALPRTKELLNQGLTLDEIRGLYGRQAGAVAAPMAGLASAGINKLTGASKLESSIFGAGDEPARRTVGQVARRGIAGVGVEGAQGGAEEGGSQLATNIGAGTVDPRQSLSEGVGSNIALGALMEGPMGGAGRVARDLADNRQAKRFDVESDFEAAAKQFSTSQDPDSGDAVLVTPSGVTLGSPKEAQEAWSKASREERETWMKPIESPPSSGDSALGHPEDAEIERVRALREKLPPKGQAIIDRRVAMLAKKRDERIRAERAKADAEQLRESAQIAADAGDFDSRRELLKEADRLAPQQTQVDGIEVGEVPAEVTLADPDVDPRRPPTTAGIEVGTVPEIILKDGRPAPDEELPSTEGIEVSTPDVDFAQPVPVAGDGPSAIDELRRLSAKTDDPDVQAALAAEIRTQEKRTKAQAATQQKVAAQVRAADGLKQLAKITENDGVRALLLARADKLQPATSEPDPFAPSAAAQDVAVPRQPARSSADIAERSRKALLAEIRQMGGIDQREMADITGEGRRNAAGGIATRAGGQIRALFTKNGVGLDRVRERMVEMGYFADDGDVTGDVDRVREIIRAALDGDGESTISPAERDTYDALRQDERLAAEEAAAIHDLNEQEKQRVALQYEANELLDEDTQMALAERYQDDEGYYTALQEAINAKREQDQSDGGGQDDEEVGGRQAGGPAEGAATPVFDLEAQTEADLKAKAGRESADQAAEAKSNSDAEAKAKADSEAKDFRLTGSNRPADVAMAGGQTGLFSANGQSAQPRPAAPSVEKAPAKPKAGVQDYGQKLEGARKYRQPSLDKTLTDDDIRSQPLSKIWPLSDITAIEDKFAAAVATAVRSEIPTKPQKGYKLDRWVEKVKTVRSLGLMLSDGTITRDNFEAKLREFPSLHPFAVKVKLLDMIDRAQWPRIGVVAEYPDAYRYEGDKRVSTSFVQVEIDDRAKQFGGKAIGEVIDQINAALATEKESRMAFEIRGNTKAGTYFINKTGDSEYRPLAKFNDLKEARAYLSANYAELVKAWEAVKERDNVGKADVRREDNRPRTGADHRNGKDVTAEQFAQTFGFRGVEFGNWVSQGGGSKDRQGLLNQAYDALMDLADIVGVPPRAMSLNGTLGLGFGSRGAGKASAHFESDKLVINLTKTRGAGTLAHEWFHALDNYFARMRRNGEGTKFTGDQARYRSENNITYRPEAYYEKDGRMIPAKDFEAAVAAGPVNISVPPADNDRRKLYFTWRQIGATTDGWKKLDAVRPVVEERFAELVKALDDSPMTKRAAMNDKGADGYWSRIIERGARSFENYVISKMAQKGYNNDYLANVVPLSDFKRNTDRYPYLKPEEEAPIIEAFDNLFGAVQTKADDAGNVAMFRLSPAAKSMPRDQLEATVANILKRWKNAPQIIVVDSMTSEDVPLEVRREYVQQVLNGAKGIPRAFYYRKKAYLVADLISSPRSAVEALFHEVLGHYGLRETFGQELRPVLEAVARYRKADVDAKVASYGFDPESATDRLRAAEEVLAELAQTRPSLILVRRAFAIIRSFLRRLGLNFNYSDDELVQNFILPARQFVERGSKKQSAKSAQSSSGIGAAQPAYSLDDDWTTKASRRMSKLVDEWLAGKVRSTDTLVLGDTPPVLRALGVPQAPVEVIATTLIKTQEGKHKDFGITPPMLKGLPAQIYDPLAVFESDDARGLVLVTELRDRLGNPVIAALHVGRQSGRAVVNRVASVYSKEEAGRKFSEWAAAGRLRYLRNEESLGSSTTIPRSVVGEVVQAARGSGAKYKTAADVPQLRPSENEGPGQVGRSRPYLAGLPTSTEADASSSPNERSELQLLGEARQQENPEERSPALGERSGLQLPRVVRQLRGDGDKVLAEADLVKDGVAPANANSHTDPADTEGPAAEMAPPDGGDRTAFSLALPRRLSREDDPFASENARIRESNRSVWDRAKQVVVRQLKPGGALHGGVFDANQVREANIRGVGIEAQYRIHDLERAVKSDYGKPVSELPLRDLSALHEALTGTVNNLPAATKVAMVAMRQYLDTQSREYVSILQSQARQRLEADPDAQNDSGLIETITKNMGHWVHRSYRAFDDPKWHQKVSPQTINAARLHLRGEYRQAGLSEREAKERAESTINGILKTGTAYGDMGSFITQSKLGAKDLGVIMKRKNIHPVIRGLLGEYVDPRINFAKSTAKMGALIANSRFLDSVRDMGLGNFLFEKDQRPVEATVELAGKQSATYAPLNGLWVTPETAQAFEDALGDQSPEGWYRWAVGANAWVNYGKTVLSPTTAMRNLMSSFFFTMANGHFNLAKAEEAWRLVRSRFGEDRAAAQRYIEKLARLGVVGDGAHEGDFRQYLESSGIGRWFDGDSAVGGLNNAAQGFYRFGDDFWKIIGFENEKAALARAGMSETEAEAEAAERIRNTYPTYSLAPKAIKAAARSPIIGSFATFSGEIIRTSYHLLRYARKDLLSDNPAIRANGLRRALGFAAANGLFFALWAMSKDMAGVDDDEDEAVRSLAPPWQKNSMFWYSGRDKDGNLQYFDLTFLNPYGMFSRPVVAALRDQPWEEQFKSAATDLLGPFVGPDIAISGLAEIAFNKKLSSGGPVYRQGEAAEGIAEHLWDTLKPGAAGNVERWYNALTDTRKRTGEEYKESDELAALFGWRMTTMQPKAALYYRAMEFSDDKRAATAYLKKRLTDPNKVSAADIRKARVTAEELHETAFREMSRVVLAARKSGLSPDQVWNVLRARGVSQRDARALLAGEVPPFQLSDQFLRSARRNAIALGLEELSEDLPSRYAEVEE